MSSLANISTTPHTRVFIHTHAYIYVTPHISRAKTTELGKWPKIAPVFLSLNKSPNSCLSVHISPVPDSHCAESSSVTSVITGCTSSAVQKHTKTWKFHVRSHFFHLPYQKSNSCGCRVRSSSSHSSISLHLAPYIIKPSSSSKP